MESIGWNVEVRRITKRINSIVPKKFSVHFVKNKYPFNEVFEKMKLFFYSCQSEQTFKGGKENNALDKMSTNLIFNMQI